MRYKNAKRPVSHMSPAAERFAGNVDKNGPATKWGKCWVWTGGRSPKGYGQFMVAGKAFRAHRWIYHQSREGGIPAGLQILHKCDNPPCVRLSHLFVGTAAVNQRDKKLKGRAARGEKNSRHKLTEAEVREIRELYKLRRGKHDNVNGQGMLARKFGVTQANISEIVRGRTWVHLLDPRDR